jgi:methionyl-tRNA formyltransferase
MSNLAKFIAPARVILVTSRITYVPKNYYDLVENLIKNKSVNIVGMLMIDNFDFSMLRSLVGAGLIGARKIQSELLKNLFSLVKDPRKSLCRDHQIPLSYFSSINDLKAIEWCKNLKPDLIINARTRCIYREEILQLPTLGCLNIHHGILPDYRGTMCDLYALYENRPAGFSIHKMTKKIDDGEILLTQVTTPPSQGNNYIEHLNRSGAIEAQSLTSLIHEINQKGTLPQGLHNHSHQIKYSKNPNRSLVRSILQQGIQL